MRRADELDKLVAKNVRRFRLARGVSQKALAAEIGIQSAACEGKVPSHASPSAILVSLGRVFVLLRLS
jgi:hypothetical protein